MAKSDLSCEPLRRLGALLRTVRKAAGLTQAQVCLGLGMKGVSTRSYLHRLEKGELNNVAFMTVVRYLQACKTPIGKFMIELVQSGAFGEAEAEGVMGFTAQKPRGVASNEEKRAKAKLLYEKRWEREFRDAQAVETIWKQVLPEIQPMFPTGKYYSPIPYLNGLREYYRVWKLAMRQAKTSDPTEMVDFAFDQVEKKGLAARLIPAVVRKVREIAFARLMQMAPHGGNT